MISRIIHFSLIMALLASFLPITASAQEILLRHKLTAGQSARVTTMVDLQGDSIITGKKAATQLQMKMIRDLNVKKAASGGSATVAETVQRITTKGRMEDSQFNEDLQGEKLQQVMFGQSGIEAEVSPLGHVQGSESLPLEQLGITLPSTLSKTGGFEFPTFPEQSVKAGDCWTEDGQILPRSAIRSADIAGKPVYILKRIVPTASGRIAVLYYHNKSDLSGLGLGNASAAGQTITGVQASGLTIELEGQIEFDIDRGVVLKTTQQGLWNLAMNTSASGSSNRVSVKQEGMRIRLQSVLDWPNGNRTPTAAASPQFMIRKEASPPAPVTPQSVTPPKADAIGRNSDPAKE